MTEEIDNVFTKFASCMAVLKKIIVLPLLLLCAVSLAGEPGGSRLPEGLVLRPGTRKALGSVQTKRFTTTDIQMISKPMQFDFMLDDDPDGFMYYVKPTYKGRICLDPYVSLIVKKDTLDAPPYHGDVKKYALDWYMARKNDIDRYLRCDISRTVVNDIMEQGNRYVLMAAPYNFSEDLNVLKMEFTYRDGMKTGYIPGTK